jgi:hypothetical protein
MVALLCGEILVSVGKDDTIIAKGFAWPLNDNLGIVLFQKKIGKLAKRLVE